MAKEKETVLDIQDRFGDYGHIRDLAWNTEAGLRAIWLMYDDHTLDRKSKESVMPLKYNTEYRIFSCIHQYFLMIRTMNHAELELQKLHQDDPKLFNSFPRGNPYYDRAELEVSSTFDGVIFQLSSLFDYLSHMICAISKKNKSQSLYWTKIAKASRDEKSDLIGEMVRRIIDKCDREFVGKLYDYRSRLLHHRRDKHQFSTNIIFNDKESFKFDLKIFPSRYLMKKFKNYAHRFKNGKPTLIYMTSFLIRESFQVIYTILTEIKVELQKNSKFYDNLQSPKAKNGLMFIIADPKARIAKPISDGIWNEYYTGRKKLTTKL